MNLNMKLLRMAFAFVASANFTLHCNANEIENSTSKGWWGEDIWSEEQRPFFYYGDPSQEEPKNILELKAKEKPLVAYVNPADFSQFKTPKELKEERDRRKAMAIMNPSEENLYALQAIQNYIFGLAHQYAEANLRFRYSHPEFDWTASYPTASFAVNARKSDDDSTKNVVLNYYKDTLSLWVFVDTKDFKSLGMLQAAKFFCQARHWDMGVILTNVDTHGKAMTIPGNKIRGYEDIPHLLINESIVKKSKLEYFPALVIVPHPNAIPEKLSAFSTMFERKLGDLNGFLIATGVISASELENRIINVLTPIPRPDRIQTLKPRLGKEAQRLTIEELLNDQPKEEPKQKECPSCAAPYEVKHNLAP